PGDLRRVPGQVLQGLSRRVSPAVYRNGHCGIPAPERFFEVMNALSVRGLAKTYKNGVQALKGIDLEVEQGDFFALLGPNGAGKTTLIGILTSLVTKTGGDVTVFGHDIDRAL